MLQAMDHNLASLMLARVSPIIWPIVMVTVINLQSALWVGACVLPTGVWAHPPRLASLTTGTGVHAQRHPKVSYSCQPAPVRVMDLAIAYQAADMHLCSAMMHESTHTGCGSNTAQLLHTP